MNNNEQKKQIEKKDFLSLLDILFVQEDSFRKILELKKSRKKDKEKIAKDIVNEASESLKKIEENENLKFLFNKLIKNNAHRSMFYENIINFSTESYNKRINHQVNLNETIQKEILF